MDAGDYGYNPAPGSPASTEPNFVSDNEPNFVEGGSNTVSSVATSTIENGSHIKDLYINNPGINSPVGLFDYLMNHTKSTIHVQPDGLNTSRYAMSIPPDPRVDVSARDYYMGLLKSDKASAIVIDGKKFMLPSHENSLNKSLEDYNLVYKNEVIRYGNIDDYLEKEGSKNYDVIRAQTDHAYDQQPGQSTGGVVDQAYEDGLRKATDAQTNKWVDESFGKNNIFGKHTNGTDTRAWARMKNDTLSEHLKARNNGGIRYTGTGKEKAFMSNLYNAARTYNVVLDPNETVESATRRIARAAMSRQPAR